MSKKDERKHRKLERNKRLYAGLTPAEQFALYAKIKDRRKKTSQPQQEKKPTKCWWRSTNKAKVQANALRLCKDADGVVVNYNFYLKTEHWELTRNRKLEESGRRCNRCFQTKDLQVHHKHYRSLFAEADEDLEVVCEQCHVEIHKRRQHW